MLKNKDVAQEVRKGLNSQDPKFKEAALKNIEAILEREKAYFPITTVSRFDIEDRGFDVSKLSDDDMEIFASKMANAFMECGYWEILDGVAEYMGLERRHD